MGILEMLGELPEPDVTANMQKEAMDNGND